MARVDIVMPLYNKAHSVDRAIRSIRQQVFTNWRLIVVDDGSTDTGPEIVERIKAKDNRIELIRQTNQGPGAARNTGLAHSNGPYTAFLDADDEWYPWWLDNAVEMIEKYKVSLVGAMYHEWPHQHDMKHYWAKQGIVPGQYRLRGNEDPVWAEMLFFFFHVGNSLVRTEVAKKYGGFYADSRCSYGEDTLFFLRIAINEPLAIIQPAVVRHHREDSGLSNVKKRPLAPFLADPETVLRYCPVENQMLMQKVLDRMALRTMRHYARNGFKKTAIDLLKRFPGVRSWGFTYYRCRYEMILSPWFAYWVLFKCAAGPPMRLFLRKTVRKLRLMKSLPEVKEESQENGI